MKPTKCLAIKGLILFAFFCSTIVATAQNNWRNNYFHVDFFSNGVAVASKGNKYALVNEKGEEMIPLKYDEIKRIGQTAYFRVKQQFKYGLFDSKGKEILRVDCDDLKPFKDNCFIVKRYGRYGVVSLSGYSYMAADYEYIEEPSDGLVLAKKSGKYGYLDVSGKVIFPFIYEKAVSFKNGKANVTINGKRFVIQKDFF